MKLKENERIDDLEFKGLKIIQNKNGFCFGIDSVILSDFAKNVKPNSNIMDLGTGTGILPILLSAKTEAKKIWGIEIQEDVANMAKRSILLNKLEEKIEIINENILNLESKFEKNSIDVIITNPPYKEIGKGIINENEKKLIPIKDPYITFLESHRSIDVKRVVRVLIKLYPELYIEASDDELLCSAQEYLNTEFNY